MKRYGFIPNVFKPNVVFDYMPETQHDESRIVDDSHYVPNRRANQILAKQFASQMLDNLAYDNINDIKSGAVNVYARQKGRDLAELTQQMRSLEASARSALEKDMDSLRRKQDQPSVSAPTTAAAESVNPV